MGWNVSWGQQVIGSFPSQDGGFEGQSSGSLSTNSSTSTWWLSTSITGTINNTGGRSGPKCTNISMTGSTHRTLRGPAIETFAAATSYIIQFYYKGDKNNDATSDYGDIRGGISGSNYQYGAYTTNANTGSSWAKYAVAVTPGASSSTGYSVVSIVEVASKTSDFDIDDVVIYVGSSADVSAPNSPGSVTVNNATTTSLDVSWGAASGGVDGGGYVVVRYATNPNADNDPNQNGIYAVGNTTTNGTGSLTGTIRYVGTGLSFTDNVGLSEGTTYYYKVYTVDKAFNYSAETQGSGTTAATWNGTVWSNSTGPDAAIEAIIEGTYTTTVNGAFTAKKLTVTSGSLTINSGTNLNITNEVINNAGANGVVIENNANLIQVNNVANTGVAVVKRNSSALKRLDYTMWSSPTGTTQTVSDFSPLTTTGRFYEYNPAENSYSVVLNATTFSQGKGFLIRMPNENPNALGGASPYALGNATITYNGVFTGIPNNGNVAFAMTTGFNAVGNPYPSRINVSNFIDGNGNITGPLYFWRKTNDATQTSYATLTKIAYVANAAAGGDTGGGNFGAGNEANWVIQIGQGFIVNATSNTNLNFTNSMRRSLNVDQFFRTPQTATTTNNGLYWLNLTNSEGVFSQMAVGYSPEGTLADDRGIDGKNINQEFYLTSLIGTAEYSIQGRPGFQADDIVLLSYKAATAGNYTISIDHTAGVFTGSLQPIYLKDNLTSALHNLNTGGYTFTSAIGTFNGRFEIVYQSTLDINNPNFNTNNVIIYNQNNEFVVNTENIIMSSIKVFDIRGRLLQEIKGINASQAIINGGLSNQVLLVQITSTEGLTVTKKVMR